MQAKPLKGIALAGVAMLSAQGSNAGAQEPRDLDSAQSDMRAFAGRIESGPALFEVSVPPASALRIDAVSTSQLDPVLRVYDAASGELLAEDDDGGEELNARLMVRGGDSGRRIRIAVESFIYEEDAGGDGGTFELRLTTLAHNPPESRPLGWGQSLTDTLAGGSEHAFGFAGEEGILLEVALVATDSESGFDPYLELRDEAGDVLASNDDGGDGLNAVLRHVMQGNTRYTIIASSYGDTGGDYTIRVAERREPIAQVPLQLIGLGESAEGRLGAGYEEGGLAPNSITYRFDEAALAAIREGRGAVTIRLEAREGDDPDFPAALDPYLELGFDTPLGFAVVDADDDGAGDLDAMIPVDLSAIAATPQLLDRLRIRASAFGDSEGGYRLTVGEGMAARAAAPAQ